MHRFALSLCLLWTSACMPPARYDVYATGYTGGVPVSIPAGASVAVVEDSAARNPLLEQEIVAKFGQALAARGFRVVPLAEAAFATVLRYGTSSHEVHEEELRYMPGQDAVVKDSAGKVIGSVSSPGTFVSAPVTSTRDHQWLTVTAFDAAGYRRSAPGRPLWIGESRSPWMNLDLRSALDYLIVPAVAAFGLNQPQIRARLRANDLPMAGPGAP